MELQTSFYWNSDREKNPKKKRKLDFQIFPQINLENLIWIYLKCFALLKTYQFEKTGF